MTRLLYLLGAWAATACSLSAPPVDDRPQTLAFITEAILKPSCATAECHSAMKAQSGDVFDSVSAARASIVDNGLVVTCEKLATPQPSPCIEAAQQSYLLTVITEGDARGNRMPLDQPMSNTDIELIGTWIENGAAGLELP